MTLSQNTLFAIGYLHLATGSNVINLGDGQVRVDGKTCLLEEVVEQAKDAGCVFPTDLRQEVQMLRKCLKELCEELEPFVDSKVFWPEHGETDHFTLAYNAAKEIIDKHR